MKHFITSILLLNCYLLHAQTQLGSDIDGEAADDWSGGAVSINSAGDRVAIGAPYNNGTASTAGHVRVYEYSNSSWSQLGSDIDGEAAGDWSGNSVSMNSAGDRVAIGAPYNNGTASTAGHVRVYEYSNSSWTQLGTDIDGEAADDRSGYSVSINSAGDRVAIGARYNDGTGNNAGHVRVYEYSNSSWTQLGTDIDGEVANDRSGYSVSMDSAGDRVAIGANLNDGTGSNAGHVRVYEYSNSSWIQLGSDIDGEAAGDYSGRSVSINSAGDRVAIGAYGNDSTGSGAGHVRVYEYSSGSWIQLGSDIDGEAAEDRSGWSVSINSAGDRVAIGAPYNNGTADQAGHGRVYEYSSGSWSQLGSDIDGEAADDWSGGAVSINSAGDRVAIGAYGNDGTGSYAGHVRVYSVGNSVGLSQIEDSHGGDFVVVSGTTTYESLPFIETFSDQDGPDQEFNTWVSAQWSSYTSTTDDYDCLDTPCTGDDEYVSFLTPPDSFMLEPPNNSSIKGWKPFNSAPNWSANPVAYFQYSHIRDYSTSMYSPLVDISDFSDLEILFDMHFDAWEGTTTNEYLYIEYCTGSGWENALTFMADATSGAVDIPWGNNSFFLTGLADIDTLQIRFRTAGTYSYNINSWYVDNVSVVSGNDPAQTTYVPDDNFEQALIDLGYDDVLDDYVVTDSINSVTYLSVSNDSISDLTGIAGFTALTSLSCDQNQLTALDVSGNTALTYLYCRDNALISLDVSNNTALTSLYCYRNQLTALDVSNNTALTTLYCYGSSSTSTYGVTNQITALDVSNNTALTSLSCGYQPITELDVSNNTALTSLYCHYNELTVLDISNNISLVSLGAAGNDLTALDVSANTALTSLYVSGNDLTALDVSNNTALVQFQCGSNDLTTLDVSVNTALEYIYCGYNELDSLDVSNNTALNNLSCASNNFTVLDVSVNIGLTRFLCGNNELTDLDVSNNTALENFRCDNNSLTSLDISNNRDLEEIYFQGNQLTSLDVSVHTALEKLYCNSNQLTYLNMKNGVTDQLTTFNATSNPDLTCIETLDPDYATTNWTYEDGNIDEGVTFAVACGNFNWHVATTGSDSTGDGSEGNPFATIQQGIDAASSGDTVSVAAGTYVENISYSGKNISVFGEDRETTIIDGNETASVVVFNGWEDSTAHLSGFTLTNGLPTGAWPASRGGGINCQQASPTLSNLLITGNSSTAGGGGIYLLSGSDAKITDVIIKENIGGWGGGGMYIEGSNAELTNVHIHSNDDGGVKLQNADVSFNYVTISDNESYGMHIEYSEPTFNHVTIVNNDTYGVGLYSTWSHPVFTNSIIANNGTQVTTNQSTGPYGISVSYSNIQGGLDELDSLEFDPDSVNWNSGNINANPLFCEPDSNNYHLSENSPCFGSGQDGADMGAFGVGCGTLDIEFPSIVDIWDVPDDQGNWVYIQFTPSFHDASDEGPLGSYTIERLDDEEWVSLHSIDAYGAEHYTTEAHTLMDSTGEDDGMTSYRIVAAMEVGALISEPAAGYSIDNIAPGVPTGLMATVSETGIHLSWDLSTAEDFQYFDLEISSTADFSDYLTVETADTVYLDADYEVNVTVYYRLVAYDDGGNASEHSVAIDITVLWADLGIAIPDEFAIHQNYPNPFNPVTTLRYDLPEQGHVRITIYDMLGRDVKTLINEYQDPGYRSIIWDATNDYGKPVSAGMYLYQIQAGEYNSTKKMVLLK